jgi:coenzyme F420-reducing hydrogenase alpha subunit
VTPAGSIQIDLFHHAGLATQVKITSTRPVTSTRVLLGKTPEQVLNIVPLLFTLCANAQAYAALLACRAALGIVVAPEVDAAQQLLVQLETLREHAWRILLDWPKFVGLSPNKTAIAALLKFDKLFKQALFKHGEAFKLDSELNIELTHITQLINELEAIINETIFNGSLVDFLKLVSEAHLVDWITNNSAPAQLLTKISDKKWAAIGQNNMTCLPELTARNVHNEMQQHGLAEFVKLPRWLGSCRESTLLNRQLAQPLIAELSSRYGNGLLVRLVGRLSEVASITAQMRQQVSANTIPCFHAANNDGIGLAQVQAARGLLIHRLVLQQGQVYDYQIVAPTEWNFHPDGVVAASLKQLQAASVEQLQRQAELLINAIDPCVEYQLNLIESCNGEQIHV